MKPSKPLVNFRSQKTDELSVKIVLFTRLLPKAHHTKWSYYVIQLLYLFANKKFIPNKFKSRKQFN
ncbi:CLUMA_CG019268, isoform A [Clunio marinus]|uniref:CLUMA_CG019268, isoform A n=1 Tax=Clunio marinus TaxID=568069 RepID=A0A1J1J1H6_9DIPT|nr:CLUMA_CG019268, isoform A [Clunio marinus]